MEALSARESAGLAEALEDEVAAARCKRLLPAATRANPIEVVSRRRRASPRRHLPTFQRCAARGGLKAVQAC